VKEYVYLFSSHLLLFRFQRGLEQTAKYRRARTQLRTFDYGNAMAYLEQALVRESERASGKIGMLYSAMGDVLVAQEGREKEAILMFQKYVGLLEQASQCLRIPKMCWVVGASLCLSITYTGVPQTW